MTNFRKDLAAFLNANSVENRSNTPDFILADYLAECLNVFDKATNAREYWYGRSYDKNAAKENPFSKPIIKYGEQYSLPSFEDASDAYYKQASEENNKLYLTSLLDEKNALCVKLKQDLIDKEFELKTATSHIQKIEEEMEEVNAKLGKRNKKYDDGPNDDD